MENIKIILASASPRRTELLRTAGIPHTVMATNADEVPQGVPSQGIQGITFAEWYASEASRLKADTACNMLRREEGRIIVISADTVVSPDGNRIFGKPRDTIDAREMLLTLSGTEHSVVGGVTITDLLDGNTVDRVTAACTSRVWMARLTERQIDTYIDTGEPFGKAGAYAIQGLASQLIESVNGDYANVVGISVALVARLLRERFSIDTTEFWK